MNSPDLTPQAKDAANTFLATIQDALNKQFNEFGARISELLEQQFAMIKTLTTRLDLVEALAVKLAEPHLPTKEESK